MYKKASAKKLRFNTSIGNITIEDLWDLPLTSANNASLDALALRYDKQLNEQTKSFVTDKSASSTLTQLKFDIVKDIIETKLLENEAKAARVEKSIKRKRILEIMANKQDSELEGSSMEELNKMLEEL